MIDISYDAYRALASHSSRVRFLILHYTAANFKSSVATLTGAGVSAHYLVPDPTDPSYAAAGHDALQIFNLVEENERASHAGVSHWEERSNLNDTSIGIEIVNLASSNGGNFFFPEYNAKQIDALGQLCSNILQRNPAIAPSRVLGHSDVAFARKSDPGPRFPWHVLYQRGVGAWPDAGRTEARMEEFTRNGMPSKNDMIAAFRDYGYGASEAMSETDYRLLVRAFQMHFRPQRFDGVMDVETCGVLYALNDKYRA